MFSVTIPKIYKRVLIEYVFAELVLIIISSFLSAAQTTSPQATGQAGITTASSLNVRASTSLSSPVLGKLPYGTRVEIINSTGDWVHISHNDMKGWVYSRYVQRSTTGWVAAAIVNVRAKPSLNAAVVYQVERGEQVGILQKSGSWFQISTGTGTGWVYESLLSTTKPVFSSKDMERRQAYLNKHPDTPRVISQAILDGNMLIGMSMDEVRASLGAPQEVLTTERDSLNEQKWIYDYVNVKIMGATVTSSSRRLYLNFRQGYLTSWGLRFPTADNLQ